MERAGPAGVPDTTEDLVTLLFDIGGMHVNHAEALAPKNYQTIVGASGMSGTSGRSAATSIATRRRARRASGSRRRFLICS